MNKEFPSAVPEIPVNNLGLAATYYEKCLGFHRDWGEEGIGQVSRGNCRLFLTDHAFREQNRSSGGPVVIWLNLNSKKEVDELYEAWNKMRRAHRFPARIKTLEFARVHRRGPGWQSVASLLRLCLGAD